jgi:hypothetical protein
MLEGEARDLLVIRAEHVLTFEGHVRRLLDTVSASRSADCRQLFSRQVAA